MTPLTIMRLIFLPMAVLGLYLAARILIPGPLGIFVGVAVVVASAAWAVLTVRRRRGHGQ